MPGSAFSDLARLFAISLIEKRRWTASLTEALGERLRVEAENRQDEYLSAETDRTRAGYLRATVAEREVFVPFTLADGMPRAALLETIIAITEEMKFSSDSPICLSGSVTFLGALTSVADLDTAEYNFEAPSLWDQRLEELATRRARYAALARAYVDGAPPDPPFERALQALRKRSAKRKWHKPKDTVFLKFVAVGAPQSPLGASNKVLGVARGRANQGAGIKSYVFQEIVITKGDPPPRTLVVPAELGNYLNFLRTEAAAALKNDRPLKAAKRLLALSRIIDAKGFGDVLARILNDYAGLTRSEAAENVAELIRVLPDDRCRALGLDPRSNVRRSPASKVPPGVVRAVEEISSRLSEGFDPLPTVGRK